ncbi:MAG: phosphatase PAP2 family protein [Actinomycetota bacterium]|nr:phosphatase PAP2 family protein [Actinomycetota bacterium]
MTATLRPPDGTPSPHHEESPWRAGGPAAQARRRRLLFGCGTVFAIVVGIFGFPTGRDVIVGWLLLFLLALCGADLRLWARVVVRDWLGFVAMLFAYDLLRGQADRLGGRLAGGRLLADGEGHQLHAFVSPQLEADRFLFGGHVPTVWLQQHLFDPARVHWYDIAVVPVYMSHFVVPTALAGVLWARSYGLFRRYIATFVTLTAMTLVTYTLFPAVPPWMASLNGFLPAGVERVVTHTLLSTGVGTIQSAVEHGQAYANPVAAVPSLHSAVPMLLILMFWRSARGPVRALLCGYVAAMTFTLVYGGEHYVVDVLLGWLYAAVALRLVDVWLRRRSPSVSRQA